MDKDTEITEVNTELTGKAKRLANLKPAWKKGEKVKGAGHPKGQRNYETIRREAIISIGIANGKTPEEIEEMLVAKGVSEALKGDFRFYKDDLDRTHGQAVQKTETSTTLKVETLEAIQKVTKDILNGNNKTTSKK